MIKIDLYNNHQVFVKERQQDWDIGRWLKQRGITARDLDSHPRIDDIITLINIRQDLWHRMTLPEQSSWGAYWTIVYRKQYPLTRKFWNKFDRIAQDIDHREQLIQQQRQRIKAQRTEPAKRDYDEEANESHSHSSHTWTVAYESATDCPWF